MAIAKGTANFACYYATGMHQQLLAYISRNFPLTAADSALVQAYFEPVLHPKNRIIEEAGKVPKYLYYIVAGYLRLFHYNDNGDEVTTHINCPPGFFTSYTHFVNRTASEDYVECITDCELLRITQTGMDRLTADSAVMKDFSIAVFQQAIAYNEQRSRELATLSAESRYLQLMADYPGILHHVPIQYIASFLGMKPESLSRIRRNLIR